MEKNNSNEIYEVKVYGNFDQKIAQLLEYKKQGISVFSFIHKHKFYSQDITWDKAYIEVFGMPMQEFKDAILLEEKKYREKQAKKRLKKIK